MHAQFLDDVHSIDDALRVMRNLEAIHGSVEHVHTFLADALRATPPSEDAVRRLSRLAREHGAGAGASSYAIATLWAAVCAACVESFPVEDPGGGRYAAFLARFGAF
jgi:hypothetical protein